MPLINRPIKLSFKNSTLKIYSFATTMFLSFDYQLLIIQIYEVQFYVLVSTFYDIIKFISEYITSLVYQ